MFYLFCYLISVVISIIVNQLTFTYLLDRLRSDNILITKNNFDELMMLVWSFIVVIVPILNIVFAICFVCFHNRIYQKIVTDLFLKGKAQFAEKKIYFN